LDNIEAEFQNACTEVKINPNDQCAMLVFLSPLRKKDSTTHVHYLHSLRVGLLARRIARFMHHDERALLMAGALHDLGKCQTCVEVLGKSEGWNPSDTSEIKKHVIDGYRMIRGRFDFTADIMVRHHTFQHDAYPKRLPKFLHRYSATTQALIVEHARIVALADVFDALHRTNDKFGTKRTLSGGEIRDLMFKLNPDKVQLVSDLYKEKIFI
jgi:putative nucleotidyltransferase with HDIG domain